MKLFCPLSKTTKFEKLISIKNFPVFMGTTKKKNYKYQELNWWISKETGSVQIFPKADIKDVYFKSHGSGSIGKIWKNHHIQFFKFINRYIKGNVCEIGGGSNSVVKKIKNFKGINNIYLFDQNLKFKKKNNKIKIIKNFFDTNKLNRSLKFDLFIHSHTFEHLYDPSSVLESIFYRLNEKGVHAFSIPNMRGMLKKKVASVMNFEHPYYYDEKLVDILLNKNGFQIIKKKYYLNEHSIFYLTKKNSKLINKKKYSLYNLNKKLFKSYKNYWIETSRKINLKLKNKKEFFLFGAHIFSQMLLFNGLKNQSINFILDNDTTKQQEYLYGTKILVKDPKIISKYKKPVVILRAGAYNNEIKKQLRKINKMVSFI